jgi:hypothetical protein
MNALQGIKCELKAIQGVSVSERGTGKATFLYARSAARAVEVYSGENSGFIVECWDTADETSDDPPISQQIVPSTAAAVTAITRWLTH